MSLRGSTKALTIVAILLFVGSVCAGDSFAVRPPVVPAGPPLGGGEGIMDPPSGGGGDDADPDEFFRTAIPDGAPIPADHPDRGRVKSPSDPWSVWIEVLRTVRFIWPVGR